MFAYPSGRSGDVGIAVCMACAVFTGAMSAGAQSAGSAKLRILFPAYGNPHNEDGRAMWKKLAELSRDRPEELEIEVIFNPASGPGEARDPNYLRDDDTGPLADAQGLRILGYVTTSYAKRSAEEVKAEIDQYATGCYAGFVSGIFFDETSSDLDTADYYRGLSQYAHDVIKPRDGQPVITISNPGIGAVQSPISDQRLRAYATAMDRTVVFEHEAAQYPDQQPAAIQPFLSADRLAHIVHSQATWSAALVGAMQRRGVANVFITDDVMQNPYDRLPTYFDRLCEAVIAANRSQ